MRGITARCDDLAAVFSILRTSPVDDAKSIVSLHVIERPTPRPVLGVRPLRFAEEARAAMETPLDPK
jgi:hypothetical protein